MNLFAIAGLFFVAIPALIVGPLVLIKSRKKVHLIWAAFLSSVVWWGFGIYKIATSAEMVKTFFWLRIAEIGVILIPVFLVHFVITFLGLKRKIFLILFYLVSGIFLYFNIFTDYFLNELYFAFNQFYYPIATPLYTLFIIMFLGSVIYVIFELFRAYKKRSGIIKSQIKYLIIAFIIGFSGGTSSYFPAYKINIYPAWNATIFISVLMVSYAILRYRLMDIRIAARKIVIYSGMAGLTYGLFYLVAWGYIKLFGGIFTNSSYLLGIVIAPLFVALFIWFNKIFKIIANKYFFFSLYNYQKTINKLTKDLNYYIDLNKIINSIVNTIKQTMQLNKAGILLINKKGETIHYEIAKVIGFNKQNGISLVQDNFLTRHLQRTQKPLIREELSLLAKDTKIVQDKQNFNQLYNNMKRIDASLCLPLISRNELMGIIVLGSKISGDAYNKEDLELLDVLSKQAAIAVENARLYKEVQDFNKTLKQKVDEQTEEIRKAYEVEKKARKGLESLNKAKSQFMLATQHHLRTPLTSMQGYLDLILQGSFGKIINKKVEEKLARFQISTKNLINMVEEILNISQFQLGRKVVTLAPNTLIEPILEEIISELIPESEKKGIYLKLEKPKKLPKIKADAPKLKMAIFNIIDNAVKYTEKGGVTVKLEVKDFVLRVITKDTGMGIGKEEIKNLFNKVFERGEKAEKLFATGRGIGLFIASKMVQAHHGKVWAESEGLGKGSTFYIELPIK